MGVSVQELLQRAVQMEVDGREYYLAVAAGTQNPLARHTFETLAREEDRHRCYFEAYYTAAAEKNVWPAMNEMGVEAPDRMRRAETVFSQASEQAGEVGTEAGLVEAYNHAMEMERRTIEFYQEVRDRLESATAREFLDFIIDQERQHLELLSGSLDVINEPEAWFFDEERWVVEG